MRRKCFFVLFLFAWAIVCALALPPATRAESPRSAQQLIAQWRQAHQKRDLPALRRLVCWRGIGARKDKTFDLSVKMDFGQPIKAIALEPLPRGEKLEYTLKGVTYRPNIAPVGRLRIDYAPLPPGGVTSSSYLVGVHNGSYCIALAAPVRR